MSFRDRLSSAGWYVLLAIITVGRGVVQAVRTARREWPPIALTAVALVLVGLALGSAQRREDQAQVAAIRPHVLLEIVQQAEKAETAQTEEAEGRRQILKIDRLWLEELIEARAAMWAGERQPLYNEAAAARHLNLINRCWRFGLTPLPIP